MLKLGAPPGRGVVSFCRSLFNPSDGEQRRFPAISAGSVPNAGESMEQRRARIQATDIRNFNYLTTRAWLELFP